MTSRKYMVSSVLSALLVCFLTQVSTADWPVNFEEVDFSPFFDVCKTDNSTAAYPIEACCNSLGSLVCPYADLLNDASSDCSISFNTYLNLAAGEEELSMSEGTVYAELCTDSDEPLELACQATAPPPFGLQNDINPPESSSFVVLSPFLASVTRMKSRSSASSNWKERTSIPKPP